MLSQLFAASYVRCAIAKVKKHRIYDEIRCDTDLADSHRKVLETIQYIEME